MITERTLKRWRRDALQCLNDKSFLTIYDNDTGKPVGIGAAIRESSERILRLTQELLDQHLLRKGKS